MLMEVSGELVVGGDVMGGDIPGGEIPVSSWFMEGGHRNPPDLRGHEMTSKWQKWKAEIKLSMSVKKS